jgi:hypothetical protein
VLSVPVPMPDHEGRLRTAALPHAFRLRYRASALGPDQFKNTWGLIATDVTRGRAGNSERLVFVFDTRRLKPSGLAGELVVAIEEETDVTAISLDRQFARTPYAVSFEAGARS